MPYQFLSQQITKILNDVYRGTKERRLSDGTTSTEDESYSETILKMHNIIRQLDKDKKYLNTAKGWTPSLQKKNG
jgi:hypothetical protein